MRRFRANFFASPVSVVGGGRHGGCPWLAKIAWPPRAPVCYKRILREKVRMGRLGHDPAPPEPKSTPGAAPPGTGQGVEAWI